MSKQTDLINIPDAITVSGSNVGINEQSPDRQLHITDASEVNIKLDAGAETSEIRLKDSDNALSLHLNNNERMELKSDEVNWTNSTNGFYNKIYGPSSGDISSGFMTYRGSTLRGGFYTNPAHGLTVISEVDMTFRANNANRMHINTSGHVTTPYQPAVCAYPTGGTVASGDQTLLSFNNTLLNNGNHFNTTTKIFTAPVAGYYFASANIRWATGNFVQSGYIRLFISKNDGDYNSTRIHVINGSNEAWSNYMAMSCSGVAYCSAGDTLRVKGGMNGGTSEIHGESSFNVYLLG